VNVINYTGARPLLSVVIPIRALEPAVMARCIASIAALKHAPLIELVVVHTGPFDSALVAASAYAFHGIRVVECAEPGIYRAYNMGASMASGRYLLFFGHDDIALGGMDKAIARVAHEAGSRVMVAAVVYMEGNGLRKPNRLRPLVAFRNWSHQGILYSSQLLAERGYDESYPVRADHVLNIQLLADRSVKYLRLPFVVSFFSAGGYSTRAGADEHFDKSQARIARESFGKFWGIAVRSLLPAARIARSLSRLSVRLFAPRRP